MAKRKAISTGKRMRIFERDGFKCVYCGRTPDMEDVVLHVDHILPVKEGGGNDPSNLRTACDKCNLGKGARILDTEGSPLDYGEIADRNAERAAQIDRYRLFMQKLQESEASLVDLVGNAFFVPGRSFSPENSDRNQVAGFIEKLGVDRAIKAATIANRKFPFYEGEQHWDYSKRWKYFCGVCWGMIKEGDDEVEAESGWDLDLRSALDDYDRADKEADQLIADDGPQDMFADARQDMGICSIQVISHLGEFVSKASRGEAVDKELGRRLTDFLECFYIDSKFPPDGYAEERVEILDAADALLARHGNEEGVWDGGADVRVAIDVLEFVQMLVALLDRRRHLYGAILLPAVSDLVVDVVRDLITTLKGGLSDEDDH